MKIIQLFTDYNVPFFTEGPNCQPGWVNVQCPFCDDSSNHLGYNLEQKYFNCWKCGGKWPPKVIAILLKINISKAKQIIREYEGRSTIAKENWTRTPKVKSFKYPSDCGSLNKFHEQYLLNRGFNPKKLQILWNIMGTGPVAKLDNKDYKNRIIAPIEWEGKIVSFQGRALNSKTKPKYKACPKDREVIEHQTILYGRQKYWKKTGICVEGITDAWKLGVNSFAVFGIDYTPSQINQITKYFKRVFIIFDNELQAQKQADKLCNELLFRGVEAIIETVDDDPGELSEKEARYLLNYLGI